MVNKTVKSAEPMMYIVQPKFKITHINNMQETFKTTQKESQNAEVQPKANEGLFPNFEKLNIEEKIEFILNLPDDSPKIFCEIITNDSNYNGELKEINDESVLLCTEEFGEVMILLDDIEDFSLV